MAILTLIAVIPPMVEQRIEPLEVAFKYPPYPPSPFIDETYSFYIDILLLYAGIVAGIAMLKHQKWAWYLATPLNAAVFVVHFLSSVAFGPDSAGSGFIGTYDNTNGGIASMTISLISLYLLSRKDVRSYFHEVAKVVR